MQARSLLGRGGLHAVRPGAERGRRRQVTQEARAAARIDAPDHQHDRRLYLR
jgi:hypothetical protein